MQALSSLPTAFKSTLLPRNAETRRLLLGSAFDLVGFLMWPAPASLKWRVKCGENAAISVFSVLALDQQRGACKLRYTWLSCCRDAE